MHLGPPARDTARLIGVLEDSPLPSRAQFLPFPNVLAGTQDVVGACRGDPLGRPRARRGERTGGRHGLGTDGRGSLDTGVSGIAVDGRRWAPDGRWPSGVDAQASTVGRSRAGAGVPGGHAGGSWTARSAVTNFSGPVLLSP